MKARTFSSDRLRAGGTVVWLIAAAALSTGDLDSSGDLIALVALLASATFGWLLPGRGLPLLVSAVTGLLALAGMWVADASLSSMALAVCMVTLTGPIVAWGHRSASSPERAADHKSEPSTAPARLPVGVADASLLERLAVHEMTRARRYEHPLALLLVDIDDWPALTAARGRRGAFDMLAALATRIRRLLRDVDAIGLHGDSRLAVLLPETPLEGALVVANRIEEAAREDIGLSVRLGIGMFPEDAGTVDGLMREAEAALDLARIEGVKVAQRVELHPPAF